MKSSTQSHSTTSSENKTGAKNKTEKSTSKATPKSLSQNATKIVTKPEKLKTLPKASTPKVQIVTESNSNPQLASTKKFNKDAEKGKTTPKTETTTKANVTPKAQKAEIIKSNKVINQHANTTTKSGAKNTTKSDKPKTTLKTTPKTVSVSVSEAPVKKETDKVDNSVVIASRVEIREGPTSVQKVKTPEFEPTNVEQVLSSSPVKDENTKSSTTSVESEETKTTEAKEENTNVTDEPAVISSSGVLGPEYDFLSRQPSEVVDETFKVRVS